MLKEWPTWGAEPAGYLPTTLRIAAPAAAERAAPVEAHPAFIRGWFEVQDAGSQVAAACAGEIKGQQVLDYCAGGRRQDPRPRRGDGQQGPDLRLRYRRTADEGHHPAGRTGRRAQPAGRTPLNKEPLKDLVGKMDLVFVDAPCTGSGTWRRHPDAKWRLSPDQLAKRMKEQDAVLRQAAAYVKPGGRLVYVTCSLLAEENERPGGGVRPGLRVQGPSAGLRGGPAVRHPGWFSAG